jgi:hypothetical protein
MKFLSASFLPISDSVSSQKMELRENESCLPLTNGAIIGHGV